MNVSGTPPTSLRRSRLTIGLLVKLIVLSAMLSVIIRPRNELLVEVIALVCAGVLISALKKADATIGGSTLNCCLILLSVALVCASNYFFCQTPRAGLFAPIMVSVLIISIPDQFWRRLRSSAGLLLNRITRVSTAPE